tara:strand:+ start:168 stop:302 length:135 start_codon:yes stop_codon:yes gene_type:complete
VRAAASLRRLRWTWLAGLVSQHGNHFGRFGIDGFLSLPSISHQS